MKTLSLLRHAKSGWDDSVERDFDRPLNQRGWRAARRMGEWFRGDGVRFDRVVASPAVRITQTVEGVEAGLGSPLAPLWDRRIYMASAASLFDILHETPDATDHLLLVGHNPGIEDLLLLTTEGDASTARAKAEVKYPTATYARIELPIAHWHEAAERIAGRVQLFVRPRDLDATLGPDD